MAAVKYKDANGNWQTVFNNTITKTVHVGTEPPQSGENIWVNPNDGETPISPQLIGAAPQEHPHGLITPDGRIGTAEGQVLCTGVSGAIATMNPSALINLSYEKTIYVNNDLLRFLYIKFPFTSADQYRFYYVELNGNGYNGGCPYNTRFQAYRYTTTQWVNVHQRNHGCYVNGGVWQDVGGYQTLTIPVLHMYSHPIISVWYGGTRASDFTMDLLAGEPSGGSMRVVSPLV